MRRAAVVSPYVLIRNELGNEAWRWQGTPYGSTALRDEANSTGLKNGYGVGYGSQDSGQYGYENLDDKGYISGGGNG